MSTANIQVSISEPVITVNDNLTNVSVTSAISNVVVGTSAFASNTDIRAALSGGLGVTYDSTTGVISIGQAVGSANSPQFKGLSVYEDDGNEFSTLTVGGTSISDGELTFKTGSSSASNITSNYNSIEAHGNLYLTANQAPAFLGDGIIVPNNAIVSASNVTTTANISGAYILGDGSQLTGINHLTNAQAKTYIEGTGLDATANLNTTANASATYFIGDGSQLTGIDSNADVKLYIETNGLAMANTITSDSNISTTANISATGNVDVTGNVSADTFKGTNIESQGALDIKINADGTYDTDTFSVSNDGGVLTNTFQSSSGGPKYFRVGSDSTGDGQTQTGTLKVYGDTVGGIESVVVDEGSIEVANGNIEVANGNVSAASIVTTGNATVGANLMVAGNLEVTGNINYREVEDLLVQDQTITLNYGNASAQDAQIIVDRQGSGLANVDLKWNETADEWQFTNDGTVYGTLGSSSFSSDTLTLRDDALTPGNANIFVETGTNSVVYGVGMLGWRDFGDGKGRWVAGYQNGNVANSTGGHVGNVVIAGPSGTFLEAAGAYSNGLREYSGEIGSSDSFSNQAPSKIYVNGPVYANGILPYDSTDGLLRINGSGGSADDATQIEITMRSANDAGALNNAGLSIQGAQASTGPGQGTGVRIVDYDGMGNVSTYLDWTSKNNANTNTNHFTIHGIGYNDPVFKVEQNSDITLGGVTTSDSNIITSANISGAYILGDGSQLTNLPQGDITEVIAGIGLSGGGTTGAVTVNLDPTITTTTASGGGALAYDNTSGVFTFTPADPPSPSAITNNTSNVSIPQPGGNITMGVSGAPVVDIGNSGAANPAEFTVQGNITAVSNVSASYFIGDGSALTNLPTQPDLDTGNIYVGNANVTVQVTPSTNFVTQITASGSTAGAITEIIPHKNQGISPWTGLADSIAITGLTGSGNNATAVTIAGVTDTGATQVNGNTYYIKWDSAQNLYGLYTDAGLLTPVQVMTATGYIGSPGGSPTATYSSGTTITPTFALADTVTVANVQLTNELQSSAGANLNINSNTKSVVFKRDFLSATDEAQIELDAEGWSINAIDGGNGTPPVYSGSAERVAWVIEGTATAGSKVISVTTAEEWGVAFGTNNFNGTAPSTAGRTSMFTGSNPIANNYVSRTKGSAAIGQTPFPAGSIIESFDSAANTITMSQPADVDATFAWNSGGQAQTLYTLVSGAYNSDIGVTFSYFSNYDYTQLGASNNSKVTLAYAEVNSYDNYGFGPTGPSASDLTYSIGTSSDYTKPIYGTRGRMALNGEKSFLNTNYGMNIGDGAVTNRIVGDQFTGYGISQLWDGTLDYSTLFGTNNVIPQIGYRQFTDGIAQASQPHLGPRFQFMSSKGDVNDDSSEWYPRIGQEIGRMGFWGSHGDVPNASSTAQPAYISVQATDDWTNGSNASVYHVGTSDYSSQYRMPFMSFEKGQLILASGLKNGTQESVEFAPGRGVTNNPANVYDFNAGVTGTAGWASINYENVGGQTGAELSVNNGGSLGAGTVGDMVIGVHRKDNSYSGNITVAPGAGGAYPAQSGMPGDLYTTPSGSPLRSIATGTAVTIQGQTDSLLTPLNGTVAYAKVYYGAYVVLYTDPGTADADAISLLAAGGSSGAATASVTFEYASSSSSGVTDKEWTFSLAEQSEDLVLKGNTTTQVTFTDSRTDLNSSLKLKNYTTTEVNALPSPQAGDTVFCTDASGGATIVFHNGTSWQKVSHANL